MVDGTALRIEPSPDVDEGAFGNECRSLGIPRRLTPGSPLTPKREKNLQCRMGGTPYRLGEGDCRFARQSPGGSATGGRCWGAGTQRQGHLPDVSVRPPVWWSRER